MRETILFCLADALENLTEADLRAVPHGPVADGERVIGELSADGRRLYALWVKLGRAAHQAETELRFGSYSQEDGERNEAALIAAAARADIAKELFWTQVKDETNSWREGTVGIRDGWQIVTVPEQTSSIFGGLGDILALEITGSRGLSDILGGMRRRQRPETASNGGANGVSDTPPPAEAAGATGAEATAKA